MEEIVGILHPGEMGAAIGSVLRQRGTEVLWVSEGRSDETKERAERARLGDAVTVGDLTRACDVILSVCPPHAASEIAASVASFDGVYVDANAVSPATARTIGATLQHFVDGGIVGGPPTPEDGPRLYLSGADARRVAELFEGTSVDARVLSERAGEASAVKMVYAAWTKGTAALLLAIRGTARAEAVEETLLAEWRESLPQLEARLESAARSAERKGWRWIAEMEEIAATFAAAGQPDGFHRAAADVFRRSAREANIRSL